MTVYDYVIVGGGPAGLTLAQCMAHAGKTVALVDKNDQLGGCHRVDRVDPTTQKLPEPDMKMPLPVSETKGIFTEHGPRAYFSNYYTVKHVLAQAGINFDDLFAPVPMNVFASARNHLSTHAMSALVFTFLKYSFARDRMRFAGETDVPMSYEEKQDDIAGSHHAQYIVKDAWVAAMHDAKKKTTRNMVTVKDYCQSVQMKPSDIAAIDQLCRYMDGASSDRMTAHEFFRAGDQFIMPHQVQPRSANDAGLFPKWRTAIENTGRVKFFSGWKAEHLTVENGAVHSLQCSDASGNGNTKVFRADRFVLAIPPKFMFMLLKRSADHAASSSSSSSNASHASASAAASALRTAFLPYEHNANANAAKAITTQQKVDEEKVFKKWVFGTNYDDDVNVMFHWDEKFSTPQGGVFPVHNSPWGVGFVELSHTMAFPAQPWSRTVISAAITKQYDSPSPVTGKTAAETSDPKELSSEVYRQIEPFLAFYKDGKRVATIPKPTVAIVGKSMHYESGGSGNNSSGSGNNSSGSNSGNNSNKKNKVSSVFTHNSSKPHWEPGDTAFVVSAGHGFLPPRSNSLPNLFSVGAHNGRHVVGPTTMEAAVSNAVAIARDLEGAPVERHYFIAQQQRVSTIIRAVVFALVVLVVLALIGLALWAIYRFRKNIPFWSAKGGDGGNIPSSKARNTNKKHFMSLAKKSKRAKK